MKDKQFLGYMEKFFGPFTEQERKLIKRLYEKENKK
jgi:hypothetical protein